MSRRLIPGAREYDGGRAIPLTSLHRITLVGCSGGGCDQGRKPEACDCAYSESVGPDAYRVIQPPIRTPEDEAAIASIRRWAVVVAVMAFSVLAALLRLFGARSFEA